MDSTTLDSSQTTPTEDKTLENSPCQLGTSSISLDDTALADSTLYDGADATSSSTPIVEDPDAFNTAPADSEGVTSPLVDFAINDTPKSNYPTSDYPSSGYSVNDSTRTNHLTSNSPTSDPIASNLAANDPASAYKLDEQST
jgi:hypothetical protein